MAGTVSILTSSRTKVFYFAPNVSFQEKYKRISYAMTGKEDELLGKSVVAADGMGVRYHAVDIQWPLNSLERCW